MSALTKCLGEVLVSVTEDRSRIILEFENGTRVAIEPRKGDELAAEEDHSAACLRRWAVPGHCSCLPKGTP